jgi:ribosomal protein S18 acetylase RimI-like enzyme
MAITITDPDIRHLELEDYERVTAVVDDWWGGRPMRAMLPRLFFEHFNFTSFAVDDQDKLQAFLIGFVSQSQPGVAYIHFVGVDPASRSRGLGRMLYERFFQLARAMSCTEVQCITSPVNTGSIEFHRKMGFVLLPGTGEIDSIPVTLNHAGEDQHRVRFQKTL